MILAKDNNATITSVEGQAMRTICEYLAHDHKRCDELFLKVESGIARRDWVQAERDFEDFRQAWRGHIDSEESIVFPALEKAINQCGRPDCHAAHGA